MISQSSDLYFDEPRGQVEPLLGKHLLAIDGSVVRQTYIYDLNLPGLYQCDGFCNDIE